MLNNRHIKKEVETLLPNWRNWYPSLFDAAEDLGVIRAEVCSPDSLMLSKRHSSIQNQAIEAHRNYWGGHSSINDDNAKNTTHRIKREKK